MPSSSKPPVSASASKPSAGGAGKLQSVTLEPTDNGGVIVRESRRGPMRKGSDFPSYLPDTTNAFSGPDEALEYAGKCLKGGDAKAEKY